MIEKAVLRSGVWVVVADGRKATFFKNDGFPDHPDLRVRMTLAARANPPTHEQGTDRPGRAAFRERHSAMEQTDWHRLGEADFARKVATAIDQILAEEPSARFVMAAPPVFLGEIRKVLGDRARSVIEAELNKDLTHLPAWELERRFAAG